MNPPVDIVDRLRHAYERWHDTHGGSVRDWIDLMAEDVVIRSVGDGVPGLDFARTRQGKAQAELYFQAVVADWEILHYVPEEYIAQGDRVGVLSRCVFRSRRTGKTVESPKADFFRFRKGEIVECVEFFDTAAAHLASRGD